MNGRAVQALRAPEERTLKPSAVHGGRGRYRRHSEGPDASIVRVPTRSRIRNGKPSKGVLHAELGMATQVLKRRQHRGPTTTRKDRRGGGEWEMTRTGLRPAPGARARSFPVSFLSPSV
ncbi:hypothetical protein GCM10011579_067410 [Streptomyces albiflavescens]|uniref:Uncharacterized protein n=1 Tax=Streptomyces albiflavescens TaxID=1623582 RepID=A0A917Y9M9_9ACTN|nr:hypothetical protein GCM10011579_067410 [Streptomyces albiflavescens]